jgi:hypothetical protein
MMRVGKRFMMIVFITLLYYYIIISLYYYIIIEGSLEVKLPTIWTVEKQR